MSLAVGRELAGSEKPCGELSEIEAARIIDADGAMEHWGDWPASAVSHHGRACCDAARDWVLAMDYSLLNAGNPLMGPRWIRHRYSWGPSEWPIHWCEAVRRKTLDCGALASIAHEVFTARGVVSMPAQFIQQYSEDATIHWRAKWDADEVGVRWIRDALIYHEGCAVSVGGGEIKVWDASAGWWIDPRQSGGYGGLLALRVFAPLADAATTFKWGAHAVTPNVWQKIGAQPNGHSPNGHPANAHAPNGHSPNGHSPNGRAPNGRR